MTDITEEWVNPSASENNQNIIAPDIELESDDNRDAIGIDDVNSNSHISGSLVSDSVNISEKTNEKPKLDLKENALVAYTPDEKSKKNTENDDNRPILPVLLIIIGFIVGVVLVAALISVIMNGNLFGTAPVQPPPPSPAQAPLNIIQAQQVAQMDW